MLQTFLGPGHPTIFLSLSLSLSLSISRPIWNLLSTYKYIFSLSPPLPFPFGALYNLAVYLIIVVVIVVVAGGVAAPSPLRNGTLLEWRPRFETMMKLRCRRNVKGQEEEEEEEEEDDKLNRSFLFLLLLLLLQKKMNNKFQPLQWAPFHCDDSIIQPRGDSITTFYSSAF